MSEPIRGVLGLLAIFGPLLALLVWLLWRWIEHGAMPLTRVQPAQPLAAERRVFIPLSPRMRVRRPQPMRPAKGRRLVR